MEIGFRNRWMVLIGLLTILPASMLFAQPDRVSRINHIDRPSVRTRSFAMGFTPFPYDFTLEAAQETYDFVARRGDIVAFHHDRGIPWPEALEGLDQYHPNLIAEIDDEVASIRPGQLVYLALTPQSQARRGELAGYWAEDTNQPLPGAWASKGFDDPQVAQAYLNFCRYLLDRFEPDYFTYAIEANGGFIGPNDPEFTAFVVFLQRVYPVLKAEYPQIPMIVSVQTGASGAPRPQLLQLTQMELVFSDFVGISTYPYFQFHFEGLVTPGDPDSIAPDLLTDITALAPGKPIAITETGYAAQDMVLPDLGISVEGREEWQRDYLRWLLPRLDAMDTRFVIWFVPRDYDLGLDRLESLGFDIPDLFYIWRDNGLLDEAGRARPAMGVWRSWQTIEFAPGG